jgi:polyisoprenoid-binding protein YceI
VTAGARASQQVRPSGAGGGWRLPGGRLLRTAVLAFAVPLAQPAQAGPPAGAEPPTYRVEPALTTLEFSVSHLGLSLQRGRFREAWGRIVYSPDAATGSIDFIVDPASVDTGWNLRDAFLRSDEMFDVDEYPVLRFRSNRLVFADGRLTAVDGELTLHGVTRGVTFKVTRLQCGASPVDGREGCGAEASGTVHRSEFGMGFAASLIGDDVELRFLVTAFRVPDTGETDTY